MSSNAQVFPSINIDTMTSKGIDCAEVPDGTVRYNELSKAGLRLAKYVPVKQDYFNLCQQRIRRGVCPSLHHSDEFELLTPVFTGCELSERSVNPYWSFLRQGLLARLIIEKHNASAKLTFFTRRITGILGGKVKIDAIPREAHAHLTFTDTHVGPGLSLPNFARVSSHVPGDFERSPNEEDPEKSYQSQPASNDEHTECPRGHILLGFQIIFGLLYAAVSAYVVGETSKPVDNASFRHDGSAGAYAMLGGIGVILGCAYAFVGFIFLVG